MTTTPTATTSAYRDDEQPALSEVIGRVTLVQVLVLAGLLVAVYWHPLRVTVVHRWIADANWSHGWLVPLFSLYFLNTRRTALADAVRRPSYVGLAIIFVMLGIYFATIWFRPITYARPLCFIATVAGVTLYMGGWQIMRIAWFPIAFLLFAVPLPEHVYVSLTMPLRRIASVAASTLLSLIPDLQADVSGVVIDYTYHGVLGSLNVEEACSGMRLLMAFVTLGVAMAYLGDRPVWQRSVMVLACVPIAMFCNIIRVTTTGLLFVFKDQPVGERWGLESLTRGTPHALLGLAMLPIALGLFSLVGWVLSNIFVDDPSPAVEGLGESS